MDIFDNLFIFVGGLVTIFLVVVVGLTLPLIHFVAIGEVEEIEQLREMVNELGIDARTEDILGKVADTNMYLKRIKRYNKIHLIQFFVPDKIADLDLIEIPKGDKNDKILFEIFR